MEEILEFSFREILFFIQYAEGSHPGSRNARHVCLIGENSGFNFLPGIAATSNDSRTTALMLKLSAERACMAFIYTVFCILNKSTRQQTTAIISSTLNKADKEINSGIPNFISESIIPINGTKTAR